MVNLLRTHHIDANVSALTQMHSDNAILSDFFIKTHKTTTTLLFTSHTSNKRLKINVNQIDIYSDAMYIQIIQAIKKPVFGLVWFMS